MSDIDAEFVRDQINERCIDLQRVLESTESDLRAYHRRWWQSRRRRRRLLESVETVRACLEAAKIALSFATPQTSHDGQDLNSAIKFLAVSNHPKVALERWRAGSLDSTRIRPINLDDYRKQRTNAPRPPEV